MNFSDWLTGAYYPEPKLRALTHMFIEVADFLRCPQAHEFQPCVVVPTQMEDRIVASGTVGCPVCKAEFPIRAGRAVFGEAAVVESPGSHDAATLQALLGLMSPGGYVVMVGSVVSCWKELVELTDTHVIGVNAPAGVSEAEGLSLLDTAGEIPLKSSSVRGVVLSAAQTSEAWAQEATRIVLPGQRVVAVTERVVADNLEEVVAGHGLWVGKKTSYSE
jgi:hypothetical protein